MTVQKTHREVKIPQISARFLADYMAASETARRTILRNCRYQPIVRVVQHDEAKMAISKFLRNKTVDASGLLEHAQAIRERMADSDFDRDTMDHNADYIEKFASNLGNLSLPNAEVLPPGTSPTITLNGLRVKLELQTRLRRVDRSNRARTGGLMLRYAKNKILPAEIAAWQSSLLLGYLKVTEPSAEALPDPKLCVTLDVAGGICHSAPSDAVRRFQNMQAACATIAESWANIPPPLGSIF